MKIYFNKTYFLLFLILLFVETAIVCFFSKGFIRFTFGDFLVVMLVYCFVKSFLNVKPIIAAFGVLIFAFAVEFSQLFNLIGIINLQNNLIAKLILGSTFQIGDLIAYTLGVITITIIENKVSYSKPST
ncbi:DUF2809 domain-containing protein [Yeosuana sp. MJ-SS3]|uniref:DUF2809 domain-containing protein n=1 Tax=Gilvirhabdus luticola TaxID=3079858 RepID=A0ABU3U4M9_9FLAO|nr:DUF2809 domain-containing protein [Yeosuana sp. MJ-SS3]MDU8885361.1 DUF2809 domain-containing protein [Yeosuana sp. MJ-SS3]